MDQHVNVTSPSVDPMKRSLAIDGMRTFCNTLIVLHHTEAPWLVVGLGQVEWRLNLFVRYLAWTLPTLFCLSGYLMMRGYSLQSARQKFWNRCKRLAVPLLVVNWGAVVFIGVLACLGFEVNPKYTIEWAIKSLLCIKEGTTIQSLWFVRVLLIFTIFSPLLYLFIRKTLGQVLTLVCVSVWCVISTALGWNGRSALIFPSYAILTFIFGAIMSVRGVSLFKFARKWWLPIAVCYIVTQGLRIFQCPYSDDGILRSTQCLFWFVFASWFERLMRYNLYRYLCESAFFVFVLHHFTDGYVFWMMKGVYGLLPHGVFGGFLGWRFIFFVTNLLMCLMLYAIGKRFCPFLTRVMNGRL